MTGLPTEIFAVSDVREIDRRAIESLGIPGYTLMCRAGRAAAAACRHRWPDARRWLVVCGAGNNAGDGYVVAREAQAAGIDVRLAALTDPESLEGDAARAWHDWRDAGGSAAAWHGIDDDVDLIVDAILGSGLERPVEGRFGEAVDAINAASAPVMALDIPTGIDGDSGAELGRSVAANCTMTFVALKPGLFLGRGADASGVLEFDGLEIPVECRQGLVPVLRRPGELSFRAALGPRPKSAHKGNFGHVLVIGGGAGMPGAAILCGEAALRAGAGKVSVATDTSHAGLIAIARPELMAHAVSGPDDLDSLLGKADVVAIGPGLGTTAWARGLLSQALRRGLATVLDADALNIVAEDAGGLTKSEAPRIITPHPGEAARLLGRPAADVQADRPGAARALAKQFGAIAVLKGANTLVAAPGSTPTVCTSGNPGMATAGMGDVLTGIIAAFLAQGMTPRDAAVFGVEAHARAGDRAARDGQRGMLAGDLLGALRGVINPAGCA